MAAGTICTGSMYNMVKHTFKYSKSLVAQLYNNSVAEQIYWNVYYNKRIQKI